MIWKNRRGQYISADDFFSLNSGKYSFSEFAEKVYLMIHTYYLTAEGKIKVEMGKAWDREFGIYMTDETFEYMLTNAPIMLRDIIIDQTRQKQEIQGRKYLEKSLIAFEFDLWLIENYRSHQVLRLLNFENYINKKYGSFLDDKYRAFKRYDLKHITKLENIAVGLEPYYDGILEIFDLIISNNRMRINFEKESIARTEMISDANILETHKDSVKAVVSEELPILGYEQKKTSEESSTSLSVDDQEIIDLEKIKSGIRKELEKEYGLILKDKDDRINLLEKDIREFKRQRDEAREYSVNQYDKGIKDLFVALNDVRYGKVMDYLYTLMKTENIDENLASYLDNLFMALEDMEIEPVVTDEQFIVNEETMLREYNLDFNKTEYVVDRVILKYAGWRYKEILMEKPTITLKED